MTWVQLSFIVWTKKGWNILQNIFCILVKKESRTGLKKLMTEFLFLRELYL